MSNFKRNVFLALSIVVSSNLLFQYANASEQSLATIGNDETKKTYQLVIDSSEDTRSIKTFYKDVYLDGKKLTREKLDFHALKNTGMILEQRDKYVVLKLRSTNFDEFSGGIITVDTLFNGANGTRKTYDIQLAKDKSGWSLFNSGKIVKQIFIQTNKVMFLGAVGIKNLIMK